MMMSPHKCQHATLQIAVVKHLTKATEGFLWGHSGEYLKLFSLSPGVKDTEQGSTCGLSQATRNLNCHSRQKPILLNLLYSVTNTRLNNSCVSRTPILYSLRKKKVHKDRMNDLENYLLIPIIFYILW